MSPQASPSARTDYQDKLALEDIKAVSTHIKCDSGVDIGDINQVFASNEAIYNECTVPLTGLAHQDAHISVDLANSGARLRLAGPEAEPAQGEAEAARRLITGQDRDPDQAQPSGRPAAQGDVMQSINNLRVNVNNHILGGSKNVIGRMRKLSMSELNRHRGSGDSKYRVAFFMCLASLCILLLYLIYQNLFSDR